MKLIFVIVTLLFVETFAGSPSYSPSPTQQEPSSGTGCDIIRGIISRLTQSAIDSIKEYIRSRLGGRAEDSEKNHLVEALAFVSAHQNTTAKDRELIQIILNLPNVESRTEWGFDLDSAWECLKEIFSDLWNEIISSSQSSSESSSES